MSQLGTERRLTTSLSRNYMPLEVILPSFKQKAVAKHEFAFCQEPRSLKY
jgi:hypothetical protein